LPGRKEKWEQKKHDIIILKSLEIVFKWFFKNI